MSGPVLVVDKSGNPRDWTGLKDDACKYYAENMVICDLGSPIYTFLGGKNKHGNQSKIVISSIIMVTGPVFGREFNTRETIYAEKRILFSRDCFLCAYCGLVQKEDNLTIDHIIPRSMGGPHTWTNTVAACKRCNHAKGARTPEQANMKLLYVPYAPNFQEKLILKKRNILADHMEDLLAQCPKNSRIWNNPLYMH